MSDQTNLNIRHLKIREFNALSEIIERELEKDRPVTVLLSYAALTQHYVNIVGVNAKQREVILMDPSGLLSLVSYEWLEEIMYSSISCSSGYWYGACSLFTWPAFKACTSFAPYNVFTYQLKKEKVE